MSRVLKKGDRGSAVKNLQIRLNVLPDGIFGELTEEAVKDFQAKYGLEADGIVGEKTISAMAGVERLMAEGRNITELIVHCTATREGKEYTVDTIRQWHKQRGFSDIGYHYVIHLDGSVENGRSVCIAGAHCVGHNTKSIGICYVGGLDADGNPKDTRTKEQRIALKTLLVSLKIIYPGAKIYGHCDFAAKACPCFDAKEEYQGIVVSTV